MKRIITLPLMAFVAAGAFAAVPFQKTGARTHAAASRAPLSPQVLLAEKFDAFSDGSETELGKLVEFENGYHIPASMTAEPGWTGGGLRHAGGCVAIDKYQYNGYEAKGYITTPEFLLAGTATLDFRARAFSGTADLWVAMCNNESGPGEDQADYELDTDWRSFQLVARNGSLEIPSTFQFSAQSGIVMIDNVRLRFVPDRIASPFVLPPVNNSASEFTAQWEPVAGAEGYKLTVIENETPENPVSEEIVVDFNGLNAIQPEGILIDKENPGYPEGWIFDLGSAGTQEVSGNTSNLNSAPLSIKFDAVGDMIESPEFAYPLDGLSFWVKPTTNNDPGENMSLIRIEVYHAISEAWDNIAQLPAAWMEKNGGFYTIAPEALGTDVVKVRFSMIQRGKADFFVDDITLHCTDRGKRSKLLDDFVVTDTHHTVSDINPAHNYYYYVKAFNGDVVSAMSHMAWVDGVAGLSVVTDEPANVSNVGFTASWQPLGHASDYKVELYRVLRAETAQNDVLIVADDFNAVDEGTVTSPETDWLSPFDFGSKGMAKAAWGATQPAWAKGMIGTTGTNMMTYEAGLVFSPYLDLSAYAGGGIRVNAKFVTTTDGFEYGDVHENEAVFAMILKSPADKQSLAVDMVEFPVAGENSGSFNIQVPADLDLTNVIIAFMNKSGTSFFVDEAEIRMDIAAGKTVYAPCAVASTTGLSHTFGDLDTTVDHAFSVTASVSHDFEPYVSTPSAKRVVETSVASIDEVGDGTAEGAVIAARNGKIVISAADSADVAVFTLEGRCIIRTRGNATVSVAPGAYIVTVDSVVRKVIAD